MSDNRTQTVGEILRRGGGGWFKLAKFFAYLIYCGGIVYVTAHNVNLFGGKMADDLKMWAYISVGVLTLNAIVLPIGIHDDFKPGGQREWALIAYGLDIIVAAANAVVDGLAVTNQSIVGILEFYNTYVVLAVPIFFGIVVWAVIWMLDPSQTERNDAAALEHATQERMRQRVMELAGSDEFTEAAIQEAARKKVQAMARSITGVYEPEKVTPSSNGNGKKGSAAPNP